MSRVLYSDRKDPLTLAERSERMRRVKSKHTKPEMIVRRLLFSMGYRYRLHRRDLPGNPDIVFPSRHKAIFVHGCFWHLHDCNTYRLPKTKTEYWIPKLRRNAERGQRDCQALAAMGWKVYVVWECEISNLAHLREQLYGFLSTNGNS